MCHLKVKIPPNRSSFLQPTWSESWGLVVYLADCQGAACDCRDAMNLFHYTCNHVARVRLCGSNRGIGSGFGSSNDGRIVHMHISMYVTASVCKSVAPRIESFVGCYMNFGYGSRLGAPSHLLGGELLSCLGEFSFYILQEPPSWPRPSGLMRSGWHIVQGRHQVFCFFVFSDVWGCQIRFRFSFF